MEPLRDRYRLEQDKPVTWRDAVDGYEAHAARVEAAHPDDRVMLWHDTMFTAAAMEALVDRIRVLGGLR